MPLMLVMTAHPYAGGMRERSWSSFIGDAAYNTAPMLVWIIGGKASHRTTYPCVGQNECKDGVLSRSDFQWNAEANEYLCHIDKV